MNLIKNNKGQSLTEYITLLILISLVSVATVKTVGVRIRDKLKLAERTISREIKVNE
jgi:Flp pilus assembly pilin Flp